MTNLTEWQARHGISEAAMLELADLMDLVTPALPSASTGKSEASAQQAIRLEAPKHGVRLLRNNVGACTDAEGNHWRFGLGNDSAAINKKIKFGDLIGPTPVTITPQMVGGRVGVFTMYECKKPGWTWKGTAHEWAQRRGIELILSLGGIAKFVTCPGDIWPNT